MEPMPPPDDQVPPLTGLDSSAQNQVPVNRTASKAKEGISCQYQYPSCPRQEATCRFR